MSLAIKRASYAGDPGLFGDIWGGIKGAIGGAVRGFTGVGKQPPTPQAGPGMYGAMAGRQAGTAFRQHFLPSAMPQRHFGGTGTGPFHSAPSPQRQMAAAGICPGAGWRLNKSDYWLKDGTFVPKGTRWVKIRRRNPANSRATSRAISRVKSAKNHARALSRVTIRDKK